MGADARQTSASDGTPEEVVLRLAASAAMCGLDGVVCSPLEAPALRAACGTAFASSRPGYDRQMQRPTIRAHHDACGGSAAGADYLVVGRPITRAADPLPRLSVSPRRSRVDAAHHESARATGKGSRIGIDSGAHPELNLAGATASQRELAAAQSARARRRRRHARPLLVRRRRAAFRRKRRCRWCKIERVEERPGGAANVARNAAALGAT